MCDAIQMWYANNGVRTTEQIGSTTIALICTNLAGVFTHWPREKAQRKAFIETRQCIEARLRTQRENQQQVISIANTV